LDVHELVDEIGLDGDEIGLDGDDLEW